jgi:hypothetical protein
MPETCCVLGVDCTNGALRETLNDCCVQGSFGFIELLEFLFF